MTDATMLSATRAAARGCARVLRDPELRRDAAQRAYIAIATRAAWRGEADVTTWAYHVGANCARELLRAERRHSGPRLEDHPALAAAAAAPAPTAAERMERGERIRDLWLGIVALPESSRASVEAQMMGVPATGSADKSRRFRAMRRLRRYLVSRGWSC